MSDEKIRVVLFADILEEDYDGVSVTLNKILQHAPKDKIDFLVVTSHPRRDMSDFPFSFILCPYTRIPFQKGYRLGLPERRKDLKQRMDDFNPHLIHYTSPSKFGSYAIKYAQSAGLPVVSIYHTHFPTYIKYYLGRIGTRIFGGFFIRHLLSYYTRTNLTLVPTNPIKNDLIGLGVDLERIKVWGRSVDIQVFHPSKKEDHYFNEIVPKGNKKVLFVSRLIKEKDTVTISKIYHKLKRSRPNYTMVLVGDGPEKRWMERDMPEAIFLGRKVSNELATIYASSDIFFFTSNTETFGNVILEAEACGLPVVAANAGGPIDLVKDEYTGYLVEPGNVDAFVDKICHVLENEELRSQMSKNAVSFAKGRTPEAHHDRLWSHYQQAIQDFNLKNSSGLCPGVYKKV